MAEFAKRIGARMKERREELKESDPRWTQDYAARQVKDDLTGAQYARWERGEVMPREETLQQIAKALSIDVADLYGPTAKQKAQPSDDGSAGPELPYKTADVERAIRMESKLDAILRHLEIDWLHPDDALPVKKDDPLAEAVHEAESVRSSPARKRKPRASMDGIWTRRTRPVCATGTGSAGRTTELLRLRPNRSRCCAG